MKKPETFETSAMRHLNLFGIDLFLTRIRICDTKVQYLSTSIENVDEGLVHFPGSISEVMEQMNDFIVHHITKQCEQ
ncbi:MAG: hypothetical protein CVV18_01835 [Gammaproteobacteria bacterium HGW-Gammaproteobacteria-8]|nr:MAG: hypothetical protein CVV18_01835 [Gammaproteobacteria bacterium HGW-Gammaproteobacteria-8]